MKKFLTLLICFVIGFSCFSIDVQAKQISTDTNATATTNVDIGTLYGLWNQARLISTGADAATNYKFFLDSIGVPNAIATNSQGNYSWNLVYYNGSWYHCDANPLATNSNYFMFLQTNQQVRSYCQESGDVLHKINDKKFPQVINYVVFDGWNNLILTPVVKVSQADVQNKIAALRVMYPAGMYWNYGGVTAVPCQRADHKTFATCNSYMGPSSLVFDKHNFKYQCIGFASMCSDFIYGNTTAAYTFTKYDDLQVGDQIRYSFGSKGHSMLVVEKTDQYVKVAECNRDCATCLIEWDRVVTRSSLEKNKTTFYIRRPNVVY